MNAVTPLALTQWLDQPSAADQDAAFNALEGGQVLWLPQLPFSLQPAEERLVASDLAAFAKAKNISLSVDGQTLRGVECSDADREVLRAMMWRFATAARTLGRSASAAAPSIDATSVGTRPNQRASAAHPSVQTGRPHPTTS
jgi:hypothetical protein